MVGVGYLDTTGLAVGLKKGFLVEKRKLAALEVEQVGSPAFSLQVSLSLRRLRCLVCTWMITGQTFMPVLTFDDRCWVVLACHV